MKGKKIISKLNKEEFSKQLSENVFSSFYSAPHRNIVFVGDVKRNGFNLKSVGQEYFRLQGKLEEEIEEGTVFTITYFYLWQYRVIRFLMLISIVCIAFFVVLQRLCVEAIVVFLVCCFVMFGVEMCKNRDVSELLNITDSHFF